MVLPQKAYNCLRCMFTKKQTINNISSFNHQCCCSDVWLCCLCRAQTVTSLVTGCSSSAAKLTDSQSADDDKTPLCQLMFLGIWFKQYCAILNFLENSTNEMKINLSRTISICLCSLYMKKRSVMKQCNKRLTSSKKGGLSLYGFHIRS